MDRKDLITGRAQPGDREPAPGDLRLVQDFVNTVDRENVVELFDAPAGLREWLAHRDLPGATGELADADLERALRVREALRALLLDDEDAGARAALEAAAVRTRLQPGFDPLAPALSPAATGLDAALGRILAVVFASMVDGRWARLKACPREVCGWAFYDRSSNASATWCSMRVCGGRVKAGAYYRRRRAAGAGA